jgi:hypothetical protein
MNSRLIIYMSVQCRADVYRGRGKNELNAFLHLELDGRQ